MSTIQVKGLYKVSQNFVEKGDDISNNVINNKVFKQYYQNLLNLGNKSSTITLKLMYIVFLERYLVNNNKTFKSITNEDIINYINDCSKLDWSISYKDNNKFQIKLFLNWMYNNSLSKISGDMVLPKIVWHRKTNIRTYYTKNEVAKMLNVIDIRTKQGKEDYLILNLICYLGLNTNTISIIQYKTDNKLTLPLINKVKYPLLDYLKNVRPNDTDLDYIFITRSKPYMQNIKLKTHRYIVKNYFIKAGVDINGRKHGFHSLRHSFSKSFSKSLLSENISLYSISNILGHKNIETTMHYLDIDTAKLKELALEVPYVK